MSKAKTAQESRLLQFSERYNALKSELQTIGFICQGSVQTRRSVCGQPTCRCHSDPNSRHGPYTYWTRKKRGKTVGRKLTAQELSLFQDWIQNNRQLEQILREMRALSARALALLTGKNKHLG